MGVVATLALGSAWLKIESRACVADQSSRWFLRHPTRWRRSRQASRAQRTARAGAQSRPLQDPDEPRHHDVDDARQPLHLDLAARHRPRQRGFVVTEDELDRRPADQQADDGRRARRQGDDGHHQEGEAEGAFAELADQPADRNPSAYGSIQHARQVNRGRNQQRQWVRSQLRSSIHQGAWRSAALQPESMMKLGQERHDRHGIDDRSPAPVCWIEQASPRPYSLDAPAPRVYDCPHHRPPSSGLRWLRDACAPAPARCPA
jgi:hypothetical protein